MPLFHGKIKNTILFKVLLKYTSNDFPRFIFVLRSKCNEFLFDIEDCNSKFFVFPFFFLVNSHLTIIATTWKSSIVEGRSSKEWRFKRLLQSYYSIEMMSSFILVPKFLFIIWNTRFFIGKQSQGKSVLKSLIVFIFDSLPLTWVSDY